MKVSDILRVKGGTLFTATPEDLLLHAMTKMAAVVAGELPSDNLCSKKNPGLIWARQSLDPPLWRTIPKLLEGQ